MKTTLTALIARSADIADMYVARCPQLELVGQGPTIDDAHQNLTEAVNLFFEHAPETEINEWLTGEVCVRSIDVKIKSIQKARSKETQTIRHATMPAPIPT